jgi:hypothetical protein
MQNIARPRFALQVFATAMLCATALPAQAQSPGAVNAARTSKAEAILGGSRSSLAAIISAQSSGATVTVSAFAAAVPATFPARRPGAS